MSRAWLLRRLLPCLILLSCLLSAVDCSSKGAKAKAGKKNGSKKTRKQTTEGAEYASDACPVSDANLDTLLETAKSKWLPDSVQDRKQALACIHDATSLFPGSPRAWYMHGFMLQNSGALEEAAAAYGAAVRTHPTESTYAHQLGGCLLMIGAHRAQEALPHLNIAHHLAPSSAPIASDFALAQYYSGRAAEAIKLWKRCEKLDPSNTLQYLYNVVGVHQERSEWKAAFKLLTRMLKLDPLSSETYESLGVVQTTRQRFGAALAAFNTSLALLPRRKHWDANDRMRLQAGVADSLMNLEHFSEALAAYADALAIAAGRDARGLTPAPPPNKKLSSLSSMLYCAAKSCAWGSYESLRLQVADAWHAVLRAGGPGDEVLIEPYAAALFGLDPPLLRDLASYRSRVMQASLRGLEIDMTPPPPPEVHKAPPLPPSPRAPAAAVATGGGRGALRIGYLSADLKTHSVGKLLQAVPALHNARRFRVLCFSLRAAEDDPVQQHLKHECAEFHEVSWMSHKAAAIHINRQHVHVLIDLMGHTRFNRLQILSLKPAPVQLHLMGSTQTVGADYIPFFVTDAVSSPPDTAALYSEKLVMLPQHFFPASHVRFEAPVASCAWRDGSEASQVLPPPGLSPHTCVVAVLNDASKVTPSIVATWLNILERAPRTHLWTSLQGSCALALRYFVPSNSTASSSSPPADSPPPQSGAPTTAPSSHTVARAQARVTAHRFQGHADFCQAYHRADIFLDTPNYCGQNTALFGIWLGVVMLTVAGEIQKHRALASMLLTHGAPHTIARTVQDYEEIAVRLALRPDLLLPLRAYLTQRPLASPLFDVARWVSGLERALSAAWDLYIMPQAGDVKLQGRGEIEPGVAGEQAGHARDFRRHLVLTP